jgi:hypothetical protein
MLELMLNEPCGARTFYQRGDAERIPVFPRWPTLLPKRARMNEGVNPPLIADSNLRPRGTKVAGRTEV